MKNWNKLSRVIWVISFSNGSILEELFHLFQDESLPGFELLPLHELCHFLLLFKRITILRIVVLKLYDTLLFFQSFFHDLFQNVFFELVLQLPSSLEMVFSHRISLSFVFVLFLALVVALHFDKLLKLVPIVFGLFCFEIESPGSRKGRKYFVFLVVCKSLAKHFVLVIVQCFPNVWSLTCLLIHSYRKKYYSLVSIIMW